MIGDTRAINIAAWDGATWTALGAAGSGIDGPIFALAALADGDLIAAGTFTEAGGNPASRIARFNGEEWLPLGSGLDGPGFALAALPNGDLIAGGAFTMAGAASASRIARWDGADWSALGDGVDGIVWALAASPGGGFFAGGGFNAAGGASAKGIARWDGSAWSDVGGGVDGQVRAFAIVPGNNDLIVGGAFAEVGGPAPIAAENIARWDGTAWSALGGGGPGSAMPTPVLALAVLDDGSIVAGGDLHHGFLGRWNGTSWDFLLGYGSGGAIMVIYTLAVMPGPGGGDLIAGGDFPYTSLYPAPLGLLRWDGSDWHHLSAASDGSVRALASLPNGDIIAAGRMSIAGGTQVRHVARFGSAGWSPMGALFLDFQHSLEAVAHVPGSDAIFVGGHFGHTAGSPFNNIANWTGSAWSTVGGGVGGQSGRIHAMAALPSGGGGDLVVGGTFTHAGVPPLPAFNIARWNQSTWSTLGSGLNGPVHALAVLPGGDLIAAGAFTQAGSAAANRVARWDGSAWSALGSGIGGSNSIVRALAVMDNGGGGGGGGGGGVDIIAGGSFTVSNGAPADFIARWDGSTWSALGGGPSGGPNSLVDALAVLESGDMIVAGEFTAAGGAARNIARWDGEQWLPMGAGTDERIFALAALSGSADAQLAVGGRFTTAGDQISVAFARWGCEAEPCYANCDGSTTPPILTVDDFTCFVDEFAAAQGLPHEQQVMHYANCDGSTVAPVLTVDDFTCFINAFAQGCQ